MAPTIHRSQFPRFLYVGTLKPLVYEVLINNKDVIRQRIFAACEIIRNRPEIFERMRLLDVRVLNPMGNILNICCN